MSLLTLLAKLSESNVKIYNQSMCVEFHKLLIATLIDYARSFILDRRSTVGHV